MSERSTISVLACGMSMPALDDRGGDEDVGVAAQEAQHPRLELLLLELAVRDLEAHLRAQRAQPLGGLVDRLDAVVEEERLPAALVLALERLADQLLVVLADVGLDRAPALGRGLDDRDVAQPGQRHLQRARDRRRAHGDHVDLQLELAQQLLLLDAEALLLVEDDQPEVLRADVARLSRRCVPMRMSTAPSANPAIASFCSLALRKRLTCSMVSG